MLKNEFTSLLTQFVQRPMPALSGRHVYLWHGELAELQTILSIHSFITLDLYKLAGQLSRTPFAMDEARRLLQSAIQTNLRASSDNKQGQRIVIVIGNSLLPRYRVPLESFFQVANDSLMIIFVVSPTETNYQPMRPLPPYVRLEYNATFQYISARVGEPSIVGAMSS